LAWASASAPAWFLGFSGSLSAEKRLNPVTLRGSVEDDGTLAVLDGENGKLLRTIDLSQVAHGETNKVAVHNVQAAPDGRTVWLTAMPNAEGGGHGADMPEELIGVDTTTYEVTSRIELGTGLHAAHVVISGSTGFVTANETDAVVVVDLAAKSVSRTIALPEGTGPHGARLTPNGQTLVVAGMGDGAIVLVDVASGDVTRHELPGRAVQTAVLPNGSAAFATIYDTRQVARLDLSSHVVTLYDLPSTSVGPVQLYPTPDSAPCGSLTRGCSKAILRVIVSSRLIPRRVKFITLPRSSLAPTALC
jgi:DNA-binding beta-propeller fold protein YncE